MADTGPRPDSGPLPDSGVMAPAYCPPVTDEGPAPSCPATPTEMMVSGDIMTDTTWACANRIHLTGPVYVRGGTLTIEAGTQIVGDNGSALIITSAARIDAQGHPAAPIVFSSSRPVGMRDRGDWGGVVLLGSAPINIDGGSDNIEGLPPTEMRGTYGGTDAAHDCGTIRYARIEFAGYVLGEGNELNGLTMGGCGTDTSIDHVQVHRGLDDAFEMFGGAPNLRYVVATGMDDDGLDWDQGFTGTIQHAVVQRYSDSASSDPNGMECDNLSSNNDASPRSSGTVYNITVIGTNEAGTAEIGAVLRRGTYGRIRDAIFMGFPRFGVDVRDAAGEAAAGTDLVVANSIFFGNGTDLEAGSAEATAFMASGAMNRFGMDPMLGAPYSDTAPNYAPAMTSIVAMGGVAPTGAGFDTNTSYVGAIGPGCPDWTAGWTAYPVD